MAEPVEGMQFDTAEPVAEAPQVGGIACATCAARLDRYWDVSGRVACERCKDAAVAARRASHVPTLLRAAALGTVAAAAGALLYYAVARITGYELGLISIVVGLMVGFAVRKGSRGRGGWRYQALAMFLCYAAICATYVPRVFDAIRESEPAGGRASTATPPAPAAEVAPGPDAGAPEAEAQGQAAAPSDPAPAPGLGSFLLALGALAGLTLALPFLAGFDNLMGLIIIGIALYEAWKVNRAPPFTVSGPLVAAAAPGQHG